MVLARFWPSDEAEACEFTPQATAKIMVDDSQPPRSAQLAALASPFLRFVAPASSELELPHGAQKSPKRMLGAS